MGAFFTTVLRTNKDETTPAVIPICLVAALIGQLSGNLAPTTRDLRVSDGYILSVPQLRDVRQTSLPTHASHPASTRSVKSCMEPANRFELLTC